VANMATTRALVRVTMMKSNPRYANQRGNGCTPFEYCSALTFLSRSLVGYKAKKAGYAAITKLK